MSQIIFKTFSRLRHLRVQTKSSLVMDKVWTFHLLAIPINFISPYDPDLKLVLKFMLHVPKISKNLISMSKAARDNCVFFEFHTNRCFVKSQDSNEIRLRGDVVPNGQCQFPSLQFYSIVPSITIVSSVTPCINVVSIDDCNNKVPVVTWNCLLKIICHSV